MRLVPLTTQRAPMSSLDVASNKTVMGLSLQGCSCLSAASQCLMGPSAAVFTPTSGRVSDSSWHACPLLLQVNKRKGEEYKLLWRESPEFVRLAAKCNALIVPFAAVGGECSFHVVVMVHDCLFSFCAVMPWLAMSGAVLLASVWKA